MSAIGDISFDLSCNLVFKKNSDKIFVFHSITKTFENMTRKNVVRSSFKTSLKIQKNLIEPK
jgi:hypothetical protein